jgi:hypothetical protein
MRGVRYVTDEEGNRVAVMLDLGEWGEVWEDMYDSLVAHERLDEPSISLEAFEAELRKDSLLKD